MQWGPQTFTTHLISEAFLFKNFTVCQSHAQVPIMQKHLYSIPLNNLFSDIYKLQWKY